MNEDGHGKAQEAQQGGAEYPARAKYGFSSLTAEKERRLAEKDRAEYEEWLRE